MTLYFLSHGRFPSRKAHTIQIARMCEAFAQNGQETVLVHPSYRQGSVAFDDIAEFYGIQQPFEIRTVPSLAGKNRIPNVPTSGEVTIFLWLVWHVLRGNLTSEDIVYSRLVAPTVPFLHLVGLLPRQRRPKVIFEQHKTYPNHPLVTRDFYGRLDGLICIAEELRRHVIDTYDISANKTMVAHDGVAADHYEGISTKAARRQLNLPRDEPIVMYTGHLYPDKQVEMLIEAADEIDASVYVVGGYEEDVDRLRRMATTGSVTFTGFVPPAEISVYQQAADVLVATIDSEAEYLSPLKLFEYMAAGKPIVTVRIAAFEEVLEHEKHCLFIEAGNTAGLVASLNRILKDETLREAMADNNQAGAEYYSWKNRAARILDFSRGV